MLLFTVVKKKKGNFGIGAPTLQEQSESNPQEKTATFGALALHQLYAMERFNGNWLKTHMQTVNLICAQKIRLSFTERNSAELISCSKGQCCKFNDIGH